MIEDDIKIVECQLQEHIFSNVRLINKLGEHIINSGGKRIRPILLLLGVKVFNYSGTQHCNIAAIIEMIHTATLLHDDVVDSSSMRRGHITANERWGNQASVLVGDFVYSRAFQMMVKTDSLRVLGTLANATNIIATGEVQQLVMSHESKTSEADYLSIVENKTAKLFEVAAQLSAIIAERSAEEEQAIANYGKNLGIAFQLTDDALDYSAKGTEFGKKIGSDLSEGRATLPLLYAMWNSSEREANIIDEAIKNSGTEEIECIHRAIEYTQSIEYTRALAQKAVDLAIAQLEKLPQSKYLDALYELACFSVHRNY